MSGSSSQRLVDHPPSSSPCCRRMCTILLDSPIRSVFFSRYGLMSLVSKVTTRVCSGPPRCPASRVGLEVRDISLPPPCPSILCSLSSCVLSLCYHSSCVLSLCYLSSCLLSFCFASEPPTFSHVWPRVELSPCLRKRGGGLCYWGFLHDGDGWNSSVFLRCNSGARIVV